MVTIDVSYNESPSTYSTSPTVSPISSSSEATINKKKDKGIYLKVPSLKSCILILLITAPFVFFLIYYTVHTINHLNTKHGEVEQKKYVQEKDDEIISLPEQLHGNATFIMPVDYMDKNVDPCNNFYAFVCGNYEKNNENPYGSSSKKVAYDPIKHSIPCFLNALESNKTEESTAVEKMLFYQKAYEKLSGHEDISVEKLIENINSFGSCPALNPDWQGYLLSERLLKMTELTGQPYLYELGIIQMSDNKVYAKLSPSSLIIKSKTDTLYAWKFDIMVEFIADLFQLAYNGMKTDKKEEEEVVEEGSGFGNDTLEETFAFNKPVFNRKYFVKVAREVVALEQKLFQTYVEYKYYNEGGDLYWLPLNGLDQVITFSGVREYLLTNARMPNNLNLMSGSITGERQFLIAVNNVYTNVSAEVRANYLCARYIIDMLPHLGRKFRNTALSFAIDFGNQPDLIPNPLINTKTNLESKFPLVSDYMYVQNCLEPNAVQAGKKIAADTLNASIQLIKKLEWLDPQTKNVIINKLQSTHIYIGALDIALNREKLDKMYESLDFQANDSFLTIERKLRLFTSHYQFKYFQYPDDFTYLLKIRASGIDVLTYRQHNSILAMAGDFYPPYYNGQHSMLNNLVGIGASIAHEVFHLLDTVGVQYDKENNFNNIWRDTDTKDNFVDRVQCLQRQYNRIKDKKAQIYLNGNKTLDEDIADNAAVKITYKLFMDYLETNKIEIIPGRLNYTNEQTYFIGYAVPFCASGSKLAHIDDILTDVHSLDEYRVNVPLMNMPEFSKAFSCPLYSKMNPKKKCTVW